MTKNLAILDENQSTASSCDSKVIKSLNITNSVTAKNFKGRACVVTLGCAKNQVDSEVMLGGLSRHGYEIVTDPKQAEVIVVNTCGFLQSSVTESVDRVLEAAEYKQGGRCRQLLVAGCMVERYKSDLAKSIPEVDHFVAVNDILKVGEIIDGEHGSVLDRAARPYFLYDDTMPRCLSTAKHTAYVKISEGCNRPCTFCIIPRLRGAMRSRDLDSILKEVVDLGQLGVKEVNYVAQDLTSYGLDIKDRKLADLIEKVDKSQAVRWQRLLYAYPIGVDEKLLKSIVELPSVVEYLDIPLQHSSEMVLKPMRRPLGQYSPRAVVDKIRRVSPQIHIRTTFIVGFPGESDQDVDDLESFIREGHFTNVGIFEYSKEQGTPSYELSGHLPSKVKAERRERLMLAQQQVVSERLGKFVGQDIEVLVEGVHSDTELLLSARARFQAPEIDGSVIINDILPEAAGVLPGQIGRLRVTEIAGYDLVGQLLTIEG